ncbi:indolethylamine N-methyltransferase-like isoform X2 [Hyperolius riggenbachi]|uniref:indolethylamine N-methyltransferase-like isoform X2 n=1 Tax=Hyperolius riggenbachi TaxID=752182 RepID=UPI0035A2D5D0
MDCGPKKFYHKHDFNSRDLLETYLSDKPDLVFGDDFLKFPMMNLHYIFSSGFVKGDVLIDLSVGSFIHHLYSACDVFKDIIILKLNERCTMETSKWKDSRTGAFNWRHASAHATKLQGERLVAGCAFTVHLQGTIRSPSGQVQDKDEQLKTAISHIISCDFENENITHPVVLPLADCISSLWLVGVISKDEDDYIRHLEKISKLLRAGGHLLLMSSLNTSYFMVGGEKFHGFNFDERFVKNALSKLGFVIDYCAVQRRRSESTHIDYKAIMFITACKTK